MIKMSARDPAPATQLAGRDNATRACAVVKPGSPDIGAIS
jgi:hypothetical protein